MNDSDNGEKLPEAVKDRFELNDEEFGTEPPLMFTDADGLTAESGIRVDYGIGECRYHPDRPAVFVCPICRAPICEDCEYVMQRSKTGKTKIICKKCRNRFIIKSFLFALTILLTVVLALTCV